MPYDPDDPRLTAYALGELDDDETAEIESFLNASPEGRRLVEEVRETARMLAQTLAGERAPGLTKEHLHAIDREAALAFAPRPAWGWQRWVGYAIAASLLGTFGLSAAWMVMPGKTDANRLGDIAMAPTTPPKAMPAAPPPVGWEFRDGAAGNVPPPAPALPEAASGAAVRSMREGRAGSPALEQQLDLAQRSAGFAKAQDPSTAFGMSSPSPGGMGGMGAGFGGTKPAAPGQMMTGKPANLPAPGGPGQPGSAPAPNANDFAFYAPAAPSPLTAGGAMGRQNLGVPLSSTGMPPAQPGSAAAARFGAMRNRGNANAGAARGGGDIQQDGDQRLLSGVDSLERPPQDAGPMVKRRAGAESKSAPLSGEGLSRTGREAPQGIRPESEGYARAKDSYAKAPAEEAEARLDSARGAVARLEKMAPSAAMPARQYDEARKELKEAIADLEAKKNSKFDVAITERGNLEQPNNQGGKLVDQRGMKQRDVQGVNQARLDPVSQPIGGRGRGGQSTQQSDPKNAEVDRTPALAQMARVKKYESYALGAPPGDQKSLKQGDQQQGAKQGDQKSMQQQGAKQGDQQAAGQPKSFTVPIAVGGGGLGGQTSVVTRTLSADELARVEQLQKKGAGAVATSEAAKDKNAVALALKVDGKTEEKLKEVEGLANALHDIPVADAPQIVAAVEPPGNEAYPPVVDNTFESVAAAPLSTFSIDVDTASYSNVRRFLMAENRMPPPAAVRVEEMINYFHYDYEAPTTTTPGAPPFSVNVELADCPWNRDNRLARIALKGKVDSRRPVSNLVFLVDVSGSMDQPNKLPLVKASLRMLTEQLGENDRVSIVVYASRVGLHLPSTLGIHTHEIASAIDQLTPGGSTNGESGINLAYDQAVKNFIKDGVNRVILCTDGDFNVGVSDVASLKKLAAEKAKTGVFLSVLGFGTGNTKDDTMKGIADNGNGNYAYIDGLPEARKVLVEQMGSTLVTIAKDVKIQVDFNPAKVGSYRLIGYENRMLKAEDFANDAKDAGEIGAGHTVTALYELSPPGKDLAAQQPESKYARLAKAKAVADAKQAAQVSDELFTVNLRYKAPDGDKSSLIEHPVTNPGKDFASASVDFKFATSVAAFGMILRNSPYKGTATLGGVLEMAEANKGKDKAGYRREFCEMVRKAQSLAGPRK